MKNILILLLVITVSIPAKITIAKLDGTVDNGMAFLLNRSLENQTSKDTVIFRVNTYGGQLMTAFDMADSIFKSPAYTIAFVDQKAISAGALISISCDEIVMSEGSTIGDCAPVMQSDEGPQILNEKIQSPLRAKFRLFADKNGYPRYLAAAMVSPDLKIYRIKTKDTTYYTDLSHDVPKISCKADTTVMVDEGELLTLTESEALETGFTSAVFANFETYSQKQKIPSTVQLYERNWSENFVSLIGNIAPILMMIGMAGIYIESRTPGVSFPGIIGVVCLLFAYTGQHMAGLAGYLELILMVLGIAFVLLEVLVIPGFGFVGVLGILLIAVSAVLSLQSFTIPSPEIPIQSEILMANIEKMGIALFGAAVLVILFFWLVFPRLNYVADGFILEENLETPDVDDSVVGSKAIVSKKLRPSGQVLIEGIEHDAHSKGFMIEEGSSVVVVGKRHGSLIVEKLEA